MLQDALQVRDLIGHHVGRVWRGGVDPDIDDHDAAMTDMAYFRADCQRHVQNCSREQAAHWRALDKRQRQLQELRWRLEHDEVGELSKPWAWRELGTSEIVGQRYPTPVVESTNTRSRSFATRSCRRRTTRKTTQSARQTCKGTPPPDGVDDGGASSWSSDGADTDSDEPTTSLSVLGGMKHLSVRPSQPLRVRMKRIKANAQQWMIQRLAKRRAEEEAEEAAALAEAKAGDSAPSSVEEDKDPHSSWKRFHKERVTAFINQTNDDDDNVCRRIFDAYDRTGDGTIDQSVMMQCLKDLGLRGTTMQERTQIREILWSVHKLEVTFDEFAHEIMPAVRTSLAELHHERLVKQFEEADKDGSGFLSINETLKILRMMGTYPSEEQILRGITDVLPVAAITGQTDAGYSVRTCDLLDIDKYLALVHLLQERTERENLDRTKKIALAHNLVEEEQQLLQHNLVDLADSFDRFATDGQLSSSQVVNAIRDSGVVPRSRGGIASIQDALQLECSMSNDEMVDFQKFLRVVQRLVVHDRFWLLKIFEKHDSQRRGALSLAEAHTALVTDCGIVLRTSEEASNIAASIEEFDEDCSGAVGRDEFLELCRFVFQRVHKIQREVERQHAARYGWNDEQIEELRSAFILLDENNSETLEHNEVVGAIDVLQRSSREDVRTLFVELGLDPYHKDTLVDFLKFLRMMKILDDRETHRQIGARLGLKEDVICSLRASFQELHPNSDFVVPREVIVKVLGNDPKLVDKKRLVNIQRELSSQPAMMGFEAYMRVMKNLDATE